MAGSMNFTPMRSEPATYIFGTMALRSANCLKSNSTLAALATRTYHDKFLRVAGLVARLALPARGCVTEHTKNKGKNTIAGHTHDQIRSQTAHEVCATTKQEASKMIAIHL